LVITLVVPIALAGIFGFLTGGSGSREVSRIRVAVADGDRSPIARDLVKGLGDDAALEVVELPPEEAREAVRRGKAAVAVLLPAGFGDAAGKAFFGMAEKPPLPLLRDPSRGAEAGLVRGLLVQHVMQSVSSRLFEPAAAREMAERGLAQIASAEGGDPAEREALAKLLTGVRDLYGREPAPGAPQAQRGGLTVPFTLEEEAVTARKGVAYDGYAHSFAGMGVQFVLMLALDGAMALLEQRRRGLFDRVRAAPVTRGTALAARGASGAILALGVLSVVMAVGMLLFGVRVRGSLGGFLLVLAATAAMASSFGLLVAALGRTPEATRGLGIFATLVITVLGGAWFPAFLFPPWMDVATRAVPTRWAMDGLDGMLWRGLPFGEAVAPAAALLAFTVAFALLARWRFRWEGA